MVVKFRNNYRKFGEHLGKIYKNSAENQYDFDQEMSQKQMRILG